MRSLLLAALGFVVLVVAFHSPAGGSQPQGPGCTEIWVNEPVVVFNLSGSILAGHVEESLIVYNSGHVVHAETTNFNPDATVEFAWVQPTEVRNLVEDLADLGAGTLCDQDIVVSETPLRTLTVLRGQADGIAHTFSYFGVVAAYQAIDARINAFVAATFP